MQRCLLGSVTLLVHRARSGRAALWPARSRGGVLGKYMVQGFTHAKQCGRVKRVLKLLRTILGVVIRKVQRKMQASDLAPETPRR